MYCNFCVNCNHNAWGKCRKNSYLNRFDGLAAETVNIGRSTVSCHLLLRIDFICLSIDPFSWILTKPGVYMTSQGMNVLPPLSSRTSRLQLKNFVTASKCVNWRTTYDSKTMTNKFGDNIVITWHFDCWTYKSIFPGRRLHTAAQLIGLLWLQGLIECCNILKKRMAPVKAKMKNPTWPELVTQCYTEGVDLCARF